MSFDYRFILVGGLVTFLLPLIPLAIVLLAMGSRQFRASSGQQLKQPVDKQTWFWLFRGILHVGVAGVVGTIAHSWNLELPYLQLSLVALLGTALHYGVHLIQGISLKTLLLEQRAYDIPLYMIIGLFAGYLLA